jgi:hypothetical protein
MPARSAKVANVPKIVNAAQRHDAYRNLGRFPVAVAEV